MHPNPEFAEAVERLAQVCPEIRETLENFGGYCYELGRRDMFQDCVKAEFNKLQYIGGKN